jgi:two-component system, NarL family, sensor histidine kinase UhpB
MSCDSRPARSVRRTDIVSEFPLLSGWRAALRRRWHDQSVRRQLMISISVISISAIFLSILLAVLDARGRVEVEVNSSMELAQQLVRDMVKRMTTKAQMEELFNAVPAQLKYVRHARILATNSEGDLVQIAPDEAAKRKLEGRSDQAPRWFTDLVGPRVGTREVRVLLGSNMLGTIVIVSEPGDELGEVWEEVSRRAVIWLGITAMMLALLYVVLGRLLNPLIGLAGGMHELEDGHYGTRIAEPPVRELAVIAQRFNTLAEALEKARTENSRLYRNFIAVQEDERRQVANELHDEAGPCLFGITANVSSIERLAGQAPEAQGAAIKTRAQEILTIADRLKTINRDLLRRLRPVELGRIPLEELIGSLVAGFGRRHPEVTFSVAIGSLARGYGEAVDLTLFRCVQEALTNAMQHGGASRVDVEISETSTAAPGNETPGRTLVLLVRDNGIGVAPDASMGIGMTAMRERVRGIDGTSSIDSSRGRGTTISVRVPLRSGESAPAPKPFEGAA